VALLTGAAPLLSTAHLIAVRHATCDHGETIEIEEIDGEAHRHAAPCIRGSTAAREHGHAHCSIAAHRHARLDEKPHAVAISPAALRLARAPAAPPAWRQIPILQLAPKSSPPA
jgi:hypothetical protein